MRLQTSPQRSPTWLETELDTDGELSCIMSWGGGYVSMVTYSRVWEDWIIKPDWRRDGQRSEAPRSNGSSLWIYYHTTLINIQHTAPVRCSARIYEQAFRTIKRKRLKSPRFSAFFSSRASQLGLNTISSPRFNLSQIHLWQQWLCINLSDVCNVNWWWLWLEGSIVCNFPAHQTMFESNNRWKKGPSAHLTIWSMYAVHINVHCKITIIVSIL